MQTNENLNLNIIKRERESYNLCTNELRRNNFQNLSKRFPLVRFNCSEVKLDGSSKMFSQVNSRALPIALRSGKILAGREEQANYRAGCDCTRFDKIVHPGPARAVVINQPFLRDNVFGVEFKPRIPLTPPTWRLAIFAGLRASSMTKYVTCYCCHFFHLRARYFTSDDDF